MNTTIDRADYVLMADWAEELISRKDFSVIGHNALVLIRSLCRHIASTLPIDPPTWEEVVDFRAREAHAAIKQMAAAANAAIIDVVNPK